MREYLKSAYYGNVLARSLMRLPVVLRRHAIDWRLRPAMSAVRLLREKSRSDLILEIPEFLGTFELSSRSHLLERILIEGGYEPELAAIAKRYIDPERDVIDVGANVGFYTILAAKLLRGASRVLAVEPSQAAHRRLSANIARNGAADRCLTYQGLAGSVNESAKLTVIDGMEEYATVGELNHTSVSGISAREEDVRQSTLDTLIDQYKLNPGFIKIDVEGFEFHVLQGARESLSRFRPVILFEFSEILLKKSGASAQDVLSVFSSKNYTLVDPLLPKISPGARKYGDLLAIPRERSSL